MKLLEVKDLKTYFTTSKGKAKAVDGVSFTLDYGQCLGLVGESGCGKTTTALSICQLLPKEGKVEGGQILLEGVDYASMTEEEIMKHRWQDVSIIFQGAMNAFNPVKKVGWQIAEACILHQNMTKEQAWERAGELFEMVGIAKERVTQYPHEFSGGMLQRALIAMALVCSPRLLIADEPTTALDVTIQAQILELMQDLQKKLGMAILMITHDLGVIAGMCDEVIIMYAGGVCERGTADKIFYHPQHEYTKGLLRSIPNIDSDEKERLVPISGTPIDLLRMPSGCPFAPRCEKAMKVCLQGRAPEVWVGRDHLAACWMNYKTGMEKGLIEYGENGEIVRMKLDGGDEE